MTNEEIKALGLRKDGSGNELCDVTIRCHVSELAGSEDYIRAEVGDGVILKSIIVAIERVMPTLPDGWTWRLPPRGAPEVGYTNPHGVKPIRAWVEDNGDIEIRAPKPLESGSVFLPALVAKALIEAWERGQ